MATSGVTTAILTSVTQLYAAIFNRAPDATGQAYWADQMATSGKTMAQVAQAMYDTTPARTYYPTSLTSEQVIETFYLNFLGRSPDTEGKAYWAGQLATLTKGDVFERLCTAVVAYKGADTAALDSQSLFTNKVAVGRYYAETLKSDNTTAAGTALASVTKDVASVTTAQNTVDAVVNPVFKVAAVATSAAEGTNATFTVTLSSVPTASATVSYATTFTGGAAAADITGTGAGTLTFTTANWSTAQTITVPIAGDASTPETGEGITVTLSSPTGGGSKLGPDADIAKSTTITDVPAVTAALTTSTTDSVVGTAGNDTVTGVVTTLASANTLSGTDKIDGGAGNDTLTLDLATDWAGFTTGSVAGVETVQLTNTSGAARTFDVSGITGATAFTLNAANAGIGLTRVATGLTTVSVNSQPSGTFTTTFVTGAAETGATTDAVTLNLSSVGATSSVTGTLTSFETVNVVSTGTNVVGFGGTLTKLNVSGAGAITVGAVPTTVTQFDASAATGKVTADLTAVTTAGQITKVALGSAASDSVTVDQADLSSNATVSDAGGTGDTLTLKTSAGGTIEYTMTGVETLALTAVSTAALTVSGAKTTGLTGIKTASGVAQAVNFLSMGSGDLTFTATAATVDAGDVSSDHTGASTVTYASGSTTAQKIALADYTFAESAGALTVNVGAASSTAGSTITAAKASSVTVNVTGLNDTSGAQLTKFGDAITAATATSFTIASTGDIEGSVVAAKATTGTITQADTEAAGTGALTLNTPLLSTLNVTTANQLNFTGSNLTVLQTLTDASNAGLTTYVALPKIATLNLSGTGTTSAVTLGNLGQTANSFDTSLTATGLKGGLITGTFLTAPGYSYTADVKGVTGLVTLDAIGESGNMVKDATITATGVGGNFTVGNIFGTGTVTVAASGTAKSVVGNVTGKDVIIDVSGTTAFSTVGTITATSSANLKVYGLTANTQAINASSTSTALAVTVTGGSLADTITITGSSGQTSLTVSGDLGASDDSLTVTSGSTAVSVNLTNLLSYNASTITTGTAADTIVGGTGVDTIIGGVGQDSLTGGGGNDTFYFNLGQSPSTAPDTITDFNSGDIIATGFAASYTKATAQAGSTTTVTIDANGVGTFALLTTAPASLAAAVVLVDAATADVNGTWAFFAYGGSTYQFIDSGTTDTSDLVVKLVGVATPTSTGVAAGTGSGSGGTGLTGFGS